MNTLKILLFGGVDQTGNVITSTFVDLGNPDEQHKSTGQTYALCLRFCLHFCQNILSLLKINQD